MFEMRSKSEVGLSSSIVLNFIYEHVRMKLFQLCVMKDWLLLISTPVVSLGTLDFVADCCTAEVLPCLVPKPNKCGLMNEVYP